MNRDQINDLIKSYSSEFDYNKKETAIILAAGHGKRIKSNTSKMLHRIWEVPTVERVCNACLESLGNANIIIVVGIKAEEVIKTVGKRNSVLYAYQEIQNGTGHAVQVALENIDSQKYEGSIYVLPGDMGLIDAATMNDFKNHFLNSGTDMLVLTGMFEGKTEDNYYGRVVRSPLRGKPGSPANNNGNVIEIIEYKDIVNLPDNKPYKVKFKNKMISFRKKDLIENREFNSGVYAFNYKLLNRLIKEIRSENAQKEIYLTDLIYLFNTHGHRVSAVSPSEQYVLMGFNNKSVLKEMDAVARRVVYEKIKDIVTIDDPDDFFIDESVVNEILELDKAGSPLDIKIGKGVFVGRGVKLNYNTSLMKNSYLSGEISLGKNVTIKENVHLSCYYGQKIELSDNVEIFSGNILKGNISIGESSVIESGVRITGSDEYPVIIGSNVTVKGVTYIFGSIVENSMMIEHSVIVRKKISRPANSRQEKFKVRYFIPESEGLEAIEDLKK